MREKNVLMDEAAMNRALVRVAHEVIERNHGVDKLVIVGIQRRGVPLAKRLADNIGKVEDCQIPVGVLDITFYRDD